VHGCADELDRLLGQLPLTRESTVVLLGDYIDRGPSSRQTIDRILQLQREHRVVSLRGNHEVMFGEFLDGSDPLRVARFIMNGGSATLESYGDGKGGYVIPPEHREFLRTLPTTFESSRYFFVHAGVPDVPLAELDPVDRAEQLVWIRKKFLRSTFRWEKIIVHGHTVVPAVEIAPNRINLDTGCVYNGPLTAIELPSHRVYSVERAAASGPTILRDSPGSKRAAVRFRGAIPVRVMVDGRALAFETVDYSEIGLGLRSHGTCPSREVRMGDFVTGVIGAVDVFQVPFEGRVVRFSFMEGEEIVGLEVQLHPQSSEPSAST
jgi:serine/threonine protein phosphatase 1